MGDEIILQDVEVIQGGLIQLDFRNVDKEKNIRVFVKPKDLLGKIADAMEANRKRWEEAWQEKHSSYKTSVDLLEHERENVEEIETQLKKFYPLCNITIQVHDNRASFEPLVTFYVDASNRMTQKEYMDIYCNFCEDWWNHQKHWNSGYEISFT